MGALYFIRSNGLKIIGTKQEELKLLTGTKKMWIQNWFLIKLGGHNSIFVSHQILLLPLYVLPRLPP